MKNILVVFLLVLTNLSYAQTGHLSFKGIPIDGHINSFINKMEAKGYELKDTNKKGNGAVMKGQFAGKSCTILLLATEKTHIVSKVIAITSEYVSWNSLKYDYNDLKDLYITKYGKPSNNFNFFIKPYYEGDGYELQALKAEKCIYATFFETEEGNLVIKLSSDAEIEFIYEDKKNMDILVKENENKVLDEI